MKPIFLKMKAFGSYAEEEKVDFTKFNSGLYWITGETGAGKTTIFDAIVFALYGEASGSNRQPQMMHSDFVSPAVSTEVMLEFEHAGIKCQVKRTIRFSKKRGSAEEYNAPQTDAELQIGDQPLIQKTKAVTDRVTEFLGLDADQFRKIVMLAQGEFQQFLKANSKERAQILSRLFDNRLYEAFQSRLELAAARLREDRKGCEGQIEATMKAFQMPLDAEEATRALYSPAHPRLTENLEQLIREDEILRKTREEAAQKAQEHFNEMTAERKNAEDRNSRLKKLEAAQKSLADLENRKSAMDAVQQQRELAEKAWRAVRPQVENTDRCSSELQLHRGKLEQCVRNKEAAEREVQRCLAAVEADSDNKTQIQKLNSRADQLEKLLPAYAAMESLARKTAAAERDAKQQDQQLQKNIQAGKQLQEQLNRLDTEISATETAEQDAARAEVALQNARQRCETLSGRDGITIRADSILRQQREAKRNAEKLEMAVRNAQEKSNIYNHRYNAYLEGQAGALGMDLAAEIRKNGHGQCPVCRTELNCSHIPDIAVPMQYIPDRTEVDRAKADLETADKAVEMAKASQQRMETRIEAEKENVTRDASRLAGQELTWEQLSTPGFLEHWVQREQKALVAAKTADQQAKNTLACRKQLLAEKADTQKTLDSGNQKTEILRAAAEERRQEYTELRARLAEQKKNLPHASEAEAKQELQQCCSLAKKLQSEVDAHEQSWKLAERKRNQCEGELKSAQQLLPGLEDALRQAEEQEALAMLAADFADRLAYRAALAPMNGMPGETWLKQQQRTLDEYKEKCRSAEQAVQTLAEETAGWEMADLAALDAQCEAARAEQTKTQNEQVAAGQLLRSHSNTLEQISSLKKQLKSTDAANARLSDLALLAAGGRGTDDGKVSFERYVMGSVFREVLECANQRLAVMGGGKYELVHVLKEQDDSRAAQSGLGIELLDYGTGKCRPTASISGGESFLVSMSLALGLSDVVQNHSGGGTMESLFIDEGFGSLSENVLDTALNVLNQLAGGNRLVGVISHVTKLEECITQRIYVSKKDNISHLRVEA